MGIGKENNRVGSEEKRTPFLRTTGQDTDTAQPANPTRPADYARKSNGSQEVIWRLLCDMVFAAAGGGVKLQEGVVPLLVQLHDGSLVSAPVALQREEQEDTE